MNRIYLSQEQKDRIIEMMNPPGHNRKDCNFFKVVATVPEGYRVEVGYWITYIGCRPMYKKDIVFLPYDHHRQNLHRSPQGTR